MIQPLPFTILNSTNGHYKIILHIKILKKQVTSGIFFPMFHFMYNASISFQEEIHPAYTQFTQERSCAMIQDKDGQRFALRKF